MLKRWCGNVYSTSERNYQTFNKIWENIAAAKYSFQQPKFSVTASQGLFEICTLLTSKQKQKLREEEKASKIE